MLQLEGTGQSSGPRFSEQSWRQRAPRRARSLISGVTPPRALLMLPCAASPSAPQFPILLYFMSQEHIPPNTGSHALVCGVCVCLSFSCIWLCDPMDCSPPGSSRDLPNAGMEPRPPHCKQILCHLSHHGSPMTTITLDKFSFIDTHNHTHTLPCSYFS